MLDVLYEKSIEKKEEINRFFENIPEKIDLNKVQEEYIEHVFNKPIQDKNFASIDGSVNTVKFMAGYVYAITSQTIISKCNQDVIKEAPAADINAISTIHSNKIDKLLSMQMNIFELKSTLATLKKHDDIDYMLTDGTIRGTLMNFQPILHLPTEITNMFSRYNGIIEEELNKKEIFIEITTEKYHRELIEECKNITIEKKLDFNVDENEMDIIMYLIGVEQLLCIYYLLRDYSDKIICVSKTSTTKSVFEQNIPDAAVIEYTCNNSGYTRPTSYDKNKPIRQVESNKVLMNFPVKNTALSEHYFTMFFTKLEKKSNVLKIEIPRRLQDVDELIEILNNLESVSVDGYPHILKKAHDEVKIKSKYMERITKNMGLNDKTGRDMLN